MKYVYTMSRLPPIATWVEGLYSIEPEIKGWMPTPVFLGADGVWHTPFTILLQDRMATAPLYWRHFHEMPPVLPHEDHVKLSAKLQEEKPWLSSNPTTR